MNTENVIEKIRVRIAKDFDMKQSNYADYLGVSKAFVSAVITGKKQPSKQMCEDVGVTVSKKTVYEYR